MAGGDLGPDPGLTWAGSLYTHAHKHLHLHVSSHIVGQTGKWVEAGPPAGPSCPLQAAAL